MKIDVLAVSGPAFISQLGILSILPEQPDVFLCSSGGNISTYIAMASDYNIYRMERILSCINTKMLLRSWWPEVVDFMPSYIAGYRRGSLFNSGIGVDCLFSNIFTHHSIVKKEIYTGTTDCQNSKCQIFCNKKREDCIIQFSNNFCNNDIDNTTSSNCADDGFDVFNALPVKYLNGNIHDIATVTMASAAIPGLVPPIKYNNIDYNDGGVCFASPLTPMSNVLDNYSTLHINYINSFNTEANNPLENSNLPKYIWQVTTNMINSMIISDRSTGISLVKKAGNFKRVDFSCCASALKEIDEFRKVSNRTMLEIFPNKYYALDITDYNFEKARDILWIDRSNIGMRFWYSSKREFREEFPDLANKDESSS